MGEFAEKRGTGTFPPVRDTVPVPVPITVPLAKYVWDFSVDALVGSRARTGKQLL